MLYCHCSCLIKMPWEKNSKSYIFQEQREKKSIQSLSYTKKSETDSCKNCPHKPNQVNGTERSKTGKLSRIL